MCPIKRKKIKRYNEPNHAHELTFSSYKNYPLLAFDSARFWVIDALKTARAQHNYSILAFVIMPDHIHVIVYPREAEYDISRFLRLVKQSVSRRAAGWFADNNPEWHNKLMVEREDGTYVFRFWQAGGGYDRNITDPDTLMKMIDYIHNNPVRKGLAIDPIGWKWSSISHYQNGICPVLDIDKVPW
jgi:putative transposase